MDKRGLLIFDLDGTLFRTETVTIPAVQETFRDRDLPVPPAEEIKSFFGRPSIDFYCWIHSRVPGDGSDEVVRAVSRMEVDNISKTGELFPGTRAVLETLRRIAAKMTICSNGVEEYVPRVLEEHGIQKFFDLVTYRGNKNVDKSGLVRRILDRFDDRPAIVIGDRQDDIEAARQNTIHSIGAAYGYGSAGELNLAEAIAHRPGDLPRIISKILETTHP